MGLKVNSLKRLMLETILAGGILLNHGCQNDQNIVVKEKIQNLTTNVKELEKFKGTYLEGTLNSDNLYLLSFQKYNNEKNDGRVYVLSKENFDSDCYQLKIGESYMVYIDYNLNKNIANSFSELNFPHVRKINRLKPKERITWSFNQVAMN